MMRGGLVPFFAKSATEFTSWFFGCLMGYGSIVCSLSPETPSVRNCAAPLRTKL